MIKLQIYFQNEIIGNQTFKRILDFRIKYNQSLGYFENQHRKYNLNYLMFFMIEPHSSWHIQK